MTTGGTLQLFVASGGGVPLNTLTSSSFFADNTNTFLAVAYDEASGTGLFYRKSGSGKATSAIAGSCASPSASAATYAAQIMAGGNGVNPVSSGARLWRTGMFNRALSEAQLDALFERHKAKLGL
jgi:hypothetical protein